MPGICQTDKSGKNSLAVTGLGVRELAAGFFTALIAVGAFIKISIPCPALSYELLPSVFFVLLAWLLYSGQGRHFSLCPHYPAAGLVGVPIFLQRGEAGLLCSGLPSFPAGFLCPPHGVTGTVSESSSGALPEEPYGACLCGFTVMYLSGMFYFYFLSNYVIHMPDGPAGVVFFAVRFPAGQPAEIRFCAFLASSCDYARGCL